MCEHQHVIRDGSFWICWAGCGQKFEPVESPIREENIAREKKLQEAINAVFGLSEFSFLGLEPVESEERLQELLDEHYGTAPGFTQREVRSGDIVPQEYTPLTRSEEMEWRRAIIGYLRTMDETPKEHRAIHLENIHKVYANS